MSDTKKSNAVRAFNSSIIFLARCYTKKMEDTFQEEKAQRNLKRLRYIISMDPVFMVGNAGPFFLKYADIIQEGDFNKLMTLDFNEEKMAYKQTNDGSKHSFDHMDAKIDFIKSMYEQGSEYERSVLLEHTRTLLSEYCKYAIELKKEIQYTKHQ